MRSTRTILLLGCLVLAGSLGAQSQFNFRLQPSPFPEPDPWEDAAQTLAGGHSFLGVGVADIDAERAKALQLKEVQGVEVTMVQGDSPAEKAGLKAGDVVIEYNGQRVIGTEQFVRLVRETPAGRTVEIVISRDGKTQTLKPTIGSAKDRVFAIAPKMDWDKFNRQMEEMREFKMPDLPKPYMSWRTSVLGVEAESLDGQLADYFGVKEGVLVRSVLKDSPAEKAGMKAGDVIVKVGDEKVKNPREVSEALRSDQSQHTVPMTITRDRKEMTVSVVLPENRSKKGERHVPARTVGNQGRF